MDLPTLLASLATSGLSPALHDSQVIVSGDIRRLTEPQKEALSVHKDTLKQMLNIQLSDIAFADTPAADKPLQELVEYFQPCDLDHRDPENWLKLPDKHGRQGVAKVECKGCGRFYGNTRPPTAKAKPVEEWTDAERLLDIENACREVAEAMARGEEFSPF